MFFAVAEADFLKCTYDVDLYRCHFGRKYSHHLVSDLNMELGSYSRLEQAGVVFVYLWCTTSVSYKGGGVLHTKNTSTRMHQV